MHVIWSDHPNYSTGISVCPMFSLLVFVVSPQRVRQTHSLQWMSEWLPLVSEVRRNRLRCSYTFSLQPLQSLSCFQFSFLLGFLSQNNQPPPHIIFTWPVFVSKAFSLEAEALTSSLLFHFAAPRVVVSTAPSERRTWVWFPVCVEFVLEEGTSWI